MIEVKELGTIKNIVDYRGMLCYQDLPKLSGFKRNGIEIFNADYEDTSTINTSSAVRIIFVLITGAVVLACESSCKEQVMLNNPDSMFLLSSEQSIIIKSIERGSTALIVYYREE